jgi:hypothetical protein
MNASEIMKKVILILHLFIAVFFAGFTAAEENEISNESGLKDLTSLEILKQDFNVHQDKVRIVTLLSPT